MKRFIGLALFFVSPVWLAAEARPVVKIQADSWCPYNCKAGDKDPGYMVEIAKVAFDSIHVDVAYKNISWKTAIDQARKGVAHGIVGAAVTDAPDFVYPDVPLGRLKNCFFTLPDSKWTFTDKASLAKLRIGVIEGYTYGEPFETYVSEFLKEKEKDPNAKKDMDINSLIQTVPGDPQALTSNIKKLNAKPSRIDAFMEDESVLKNFLHSKGLSPSTYRNAGCLPPDAVFIAFGPKEPKAKEYAKLMSDTVTAMRKDGRLKKLLDKYGISDWAQ